MQDLVLARDGHVFADSRAVAEKFGKRHADVLRSIDSLLGQEAELNGRNFALVEYIDDKGEQRPAYDMDRDGFALLAMGFTGKSALKWKLRYIEAFNAMETQLRKASVPAMLQAQVEAMRLELAELRQLLPKPRAVDPQRLVLRLIRDRDVMSRGVLSRKVDGRLTVEQIDLAIESLFEAGQIEIIQGRTHDRIGGRPATYYAAVD